MNNVQVCCSHFPWLVLLMSLCECNRKSCTWASARWDDMEDSSEVVVQCDLKFVKREEGKFFQQAVTTLCGFYPIMASFLCCSPEFIPWMHDFNG